MQGRVQCWTTFRTGQRSALKSVPVLALIRGTVQRMDQRLDQRLDRSMDLRLDDCIDQRINRRIV